MFAGLGVIVDRESGAQRELLAAPIRRSLLVLGNLAVAFAITALQVAVLIAVAIARGIDFNATATGVVWFVAAAALFTVGMYGVAETLASRVPKAGGVHRPRARDRDRALVPGRLAVSDQRAARFLEWFAKFLPLTHGLALVRYGLLGDSSGLHDIWSMHSTTMMATLSLAVVAAFAAALTVISIRVFNRSAVR